jgi:proteic killer suppression protein
VIRSFGDAATRDLFHGSKTARARRIPAAIAPAARRKLDQIALYAENLNDLRMPPSNHLEALHGDLAGYHSIRIDRQWRIVFRWIDGAAEDVSITDYHA